MLWFLLQPALTLTPTRTPTPAPDPELSLPPPPPWAWPGLLRCASAGPRQGRGGTPRLQDNAAAVTPPRPSPSPTPPSLTDEREPGPHRVRLLRRCERQLVRSEERVTTLLAERPPAPSMWEQARRRVYYVQR